MLYHQTWPAPYLVVDDDQLEQQRRRQDPSLRQDLSSCPLDPPQHRLHTLRALRILPHTFGTEVLGQGEFLQSIWFSGTYRSCDNVRLDTGW